MRLIVKCEHAILHVYLYLYRKWMINMLKKNKDTVKHVINCYSFVINLRLHLHSFKIL